MNAPVTIPQIFYDVIARVFPGGLFLFALNCEISGTSLGFIQVPPPSAETWGGTVLGGVGYAVLAYFVGWVLLAATFRSLRDTVRTEVEPGLQTHEFYEMSHWIRIKNPAEGFRIAKLRAEARMIETSRTGMCFVFLLAVALLWGALVSRGLVQQSVLGWVVRLLVPLALACAFRRLERRAWRNYWANIPTTYKILRKILCVSESESDIRPDRQVEGTLQ